MFRATNPLSFSKVQSSSKQGGNNSSDDSTEGLIGHASAIVNQIIDENYPEDESWAYGNDILPDLMEDDFQEVFGKWDTELQPINFDPALEEDEIGDDARPAIPPINAESLCKEATEPLMKVFKDTVNYALIGSKDKNTNFNFKHTVFGKVFDTINDLNDAYQNKLDMHMLNVVKQIESANYSSTEFRNATVLQLVELLKEKCRNSSEEVIREIISLLHDTLVQGLMEIMNHIERGLTGKSSTFSMLQHDMGLEVHEDYLNYHPDLVVINKTNNALAVIEIKTGIITRPKMQAAVSKYVNPTNQLGGSLFVIGSNNFEEKLADLSDYLSIDRCNSLMIEVISSFAQSRIFRKKIDEVASMLGISYLESDDSRDSFAEFVPAVENRLTTVLKRKIDEIIAHNIEVNSTETTIEGIADAFRVFTNKQVYKEITLEEIEDTMDELRERLDTMDDAMGENKVIQRYHNSNYHVVVNNGACVKTKILKDNNDDYYEEIIRPIRFDYDFNYVFVDNVQGLAACHSVKPSIPGFLPSSPYAIHRIDTWARFPRLIDQIYQSDQVTGIGGELKFLMNSNYKDKNGEYRKNFDGKNKIRVKPKDLSKRYFTRCKALMQLYDFCTKPRRDAIENNYVEKKKILSISSSHWSDSETIVTSCLNGLKQLNDNKINLLNGSRDYNPRQGMDIKMENHANYQLNLVNRTNAARVLMSYQSLANLIFNNGTKLRKYFYLCDGGSKDFGFLIFPHGIVNNDSVQVSFCTITRCPVLRTQERVFSTFEINNELFCVSYPNSVNLPRLDAFRQCYHTSAAFALTCSNSSDNWSEKEKSEFLIDSFSFSVFQTLNVNQDVSLLFDVLKYLSNMAQSNWGNIKCLLLDKFQIKVKSHYAAYLITKFESFMKELCTSTRHTRTIEIVRSGELYGEIDEDSYGISGKWPSIVSNIKHDSYRNFQNECSGLLMLRHKSYMGSQEMPKQYIRLLDIEQEYKDSCAASDIAYHSASIKELVESTNLGVCNLYITGLATKLYTLQHHERQTEFIDRFNSKRMTDNITKICTLNGVRKGNGFSTSIKDALEYISKSNDHNTSLYKYVSDNIGSDMLIAMANKDQRGGTRPITSTTLEMKAMLRIAEDIQKSLGETDHDNIVVPNKNKQVSISMAFKELIAQNSTSKIGSRIFASEDKKKFSESWNNLTFVASTMENDFLTEKMKDYLIHVIYKTRHRKLMVNHSIHEKFFEPYPDAYEEVMSGKDITLTTGWPQGFFNHWSTNIASMANWFSHKIAEAYFKRQIPVVNRVHSDDSCCGVVLEDSEVQTYFLIRNTICKAMGMKISNTKTYLSKSYMEIVSNFCINGEVVQPFCKAAINMFSGYSYRGPDKDTVDMLNRVKEVHRQGASITLCHTLRKLGQDQIHRLYLNGPGQINDPTKLISNIVLIKEDRSEISLADIKVDRTQVPLGLFGSPNITTTELTVASANADERNKIQSIYKVMNTIRDNSIEYSELCLTGRIVEDDKKVRDLISVGLIAQCYGRSKSSIDAAGGSSGLLSGLKLHCHNTRLRKKTEQFYKSMEHVDEGKSFPLYKPLTSNLLALEYYKDMAKTEIYQDAVSKLTNDKVANCRRLAIMLKTKAWSFKLPDTEDLRPLTENQQVNHNSSNTALNTIQGIFNHLVEQCFSYQFFPQYIGFVTEMKEHYDRDLITKEILNSVRDLNFVSEKDQVRPYVVNIPPVIRLSMVTPENAIKSLMSIYNPSIYRQCYGEVDDLTKMYSRQLRERFEAIIDTSEASTAVMVYNIIKNEETRKTPYYCKRLNTSDYNSFVKTVVEQTMETGKRISTIGSGLRKAITNLKDFSSIAPLYNLIVSQKINTCIKSINITNQRFLPSKEDLVQEYQISNYPHKKMLSVIETYLFGTTDLLEDVANRSSTSGSRWINPQMLVNCRSVNGKKYRRYLGHGLLEVKYSGASMRVGVTTWDPCAVDKRYWPSRDLKGRNHSGIDHITVNTKDQKLISSMFAIACANITRMDATSSISSIFNYKENQRSSLLKCTDNNLALYKRNRWKTLTVYIGKGEITVQSDAVARPGRFAYIICYEDFKPQEYALDTNLTDIVYERMSITSQGKHLTYLPSLVPHADYAFAEVILDLNGLDHKIYGNDIACIVHGRLSEASTNLVSAVSNSLTLIGPDKVADLFLSMYTTNKLPLYRTNTRRVAEPSKELISDLTFDEAQKVLNEGILDYDDLLDSDVSLASLSVSGEPSHISDNTSTTSSHSDHAGMYRTEQANKKHEEIESNIRTNSGIASGSSIDLMEAQNVEVPYDSDNEFEIDVDPNNIKETMDSVEQFNDHMVKQSLIDKIGLTGEIENIIVKLDLNKYLLNTFGVPYYDDIVFSIHSATSLPVPIDALMTEVSIIKNEQMKLLKSGYARTTTNIKDIISAVCNDETVCGYFVAACCGVIAPSQLYRVIERIDEESNSIFLVEKKNKNGKIKLSSMSRRLDISVKVRQAFSKYNYDKDSSDDDNDPLLDY